jgi:hypothetical protein
VRRQILADDQVEAGLKAEFAYYLCAGPRGTTDDDLIRVAGSVGDRAVFQVVKNEVGGGGTGTTRRVVGPGEAGAR